MKARVRKLLAEGDVADIVALAGQNRRVFSYLTALTYDPDPLVADRAVEALGLVAGALSDTDAEFVRGHLRRLFWLLNDESGGIGWRAAEAIGEIIRARPDRFAEFIPNLVALLDMEAEDAPRFRDSILRAIGRVAEVRAAAMSFERIQGQV
ncbi:MAG: HEAT repeat domain-containing protein [Chloroflexi bacterium]|nr:HEAT repeat domain-containing protein [Chloroflexota bacterium]